MSILRWIIVDCTLQELRHLFYILMETCPETNPHKCLHCGKLCEGKDCLATRIRVHSGEHPYSCSLCDKSFTQNSGLASHMITHSEETPYVCLTCWKKFTHVKALPSALIQTRPNICARFVGNHLRGQIVWMYIWDFIQAKSLTHVLFVTKHLVVAASSQSTWKHIQTRPHIGARLVGNLSKGNLIWLYIWEYIQMKNLSHALCVPNLSGKVAVFIITWKLTQMRPRISVQLVAKASRSKDTWLHISEFIQGNIPCMFCMWQKIQPKK